MWRGSVSRIGVARFADFERGNFDGITYSDTFSKANPDMPRARTSMFKIKLV
jgi:hypothetical protein